MPNRAMSNRGEAVAIISIAQHARPNVASHSDPLRTNPATFSTVDSRMPPGSCSSSPTRGHPAARRRRPRTR